MKINDLDAYPNEVDYIEKLDSYRYENIFKIAEYYDGHVFFNIFKNITIPENINTNYYYWIRYENETWPYLSYKCYDTIHLWWLILAANQIKNPVLRPPRGTLLKIIKRAYLKDIIAQIQEQK